MTMVRSSPGQINSGSLLKMGVFFFGVILLAHAFGVPGAAQDGGVADATPVAERILSFLRAHPRIRGRFEHVYLDRARDVEVRSSGRFAVELPRIGVSFDGADGQRIAIDATTARVLWPQEGEPPLALSFRIDTTPLPALLAVVAGTTPLTDAYAVRRIEAEGGDVIELRPTDTTAQVDRLWIEADGSGAIGRVMVVDWRGVTHRIVISEVAYPARVPESALAPSFPTDAVVVEP